MGAPPVTQPSGNPPPSQNIQTRPPAVSFQTSNVPPTQYTYFQEADLLQLWIITNIVAPQVKINYRYLTPQAEVKEGQVIFSVSSLVGGNTFRVGEGWLLSLTLELPAQPVAGGWLFAQILVTRQSQSFAAGVNQGTLWQGYVYFNSFSGFPGTPPRTFNSDAGTLRSITGTTPGAGADISESVPSNRRWRLLSLAAQLTTSAAVANRIVFASLDDGVNIYYRTPLSAAEPASQTVHYTFAPVGGQPGVASDPYALYYDNRQRLAAGFNIKTNTIGMQAADQWSAVHYLIEEWPNWDS